MNGVGRTTWDARQAVDRELTGTETIRWVVVPSLRPVLLDTAFGAITALLIASYGISFYFELSARSPPLPNGFTRFVFALALPTVFAVFGVFAAACAVFR